MSEVQLNVSFITWYPTCRRSDALAYALGGPSHLIHYLTFKKPLHAPLKYVFQAWDTFRYLRRDRPQVVAVASPPVFAVLAVWAYCKLFDTRYIIDAHTGVFDDPRWTWMLPLSRYLARHALINIVTNSHLEAQVTEWGAATVVIGDVPVAFPSVLPMQLGVGFHAAVINSFSHDEPLDEILSAARSLPTISFHITGDPKHARNHWREPLPANARFTGWLSDDEYAGLLMGSNAIICLTTRDHTMQRGAYEAMALEKPLITSNWELLRQTFRRGTIHVDNSAPQIAAAVVQVAENAASLQAGMRQLRYERWREFEHRVKKVRRMVRSKLYEEG
jgi:glycosyltransferase involved in cell wall biosynthesis